jgi:hypothetical protein
MQNSRPRAAAGAVRHHVSAAVGNGTFGKAFQVLNEYFEKQVKGGPA